MYERLFRKKLGKNENLSWTSLLFDFFVFVVGFGFSDCIILLLPLIEPVVNCYCAVRVLFYIVCDYEAWHLILSEYIMEGRGAYTQLLSYSTLLLIIIFHPFCEFIHLVTFFYFFLWTKIRKFDTLRSIPSKTV